MRYLDTIEDCGVDESCVWGQAALSRQNKSVGFGHERSLVNVYVANRPPLLAYQQLTSLVPMQPSEIAYIVANSSNHWRKAFNVLAKLMHALPVLPNTADSRWQTYRDTALLQATGNESLLFSAPRWREPAIVAPPVHIIAGKTYAASLDLPPLTWLDSYFAVNLSHQLVVAPYLDYRQLSNARIDQLAEIVTPWLQMAAGHLQQVQNNKVVSECL